MSGIEGGRKCGKTARMMEQVRALIEKNTSGAVKQERIVFIVDATAALLGDALWWQWQLGPHVAVYWQVDPRTLKGGNQW